MRKPADPMPVDPNAPTPGEFRLDGSWNPEGVPPDHRDPKHSLHWFVEMLVTKRRREPACPPWMFAKRIATSPWRDAFPSARVDDYLATQADRLHWTATFKLRGESVPLAWFQAGAITSAEAAVKLGGYPAGSDAAMALLKAEVRGRADLGRIGPPELTVLLASFLPAMVMPDPEHAARVMRQVAELHEEQAQRQADGAIEVPDEAGVEPAPDRGRAGSLGL